ncbi:MAG: carboxylesterase family protein [Dehalococcoidia bacterium]|nr:carboxylesterase family protein [Dehalococcoidia bacterium]
MKVYRTAREERGQSTEPREIALAIATDWVFRFPAMRLAELQSRHVPVYCYLFDWPSPAPDLGAAHLVETPFVFGTYGHEDIRRFAGDGEAAAELSAQMQDAWVRFARFGSPTTQLLQECASRTTRRFSAGRCGWDR